VGADVLPIIDGQPEKHFEFRSHFCNCATALVRKENPCCQVVWNLTSLDCSLNPYPANLENRVSL